MPDGWPLPYRSFNLDELEPYEGKLAELGVPTLILFGAKDEVLPRDYGGWRRMIGIVRPACAARFR